MGRVSLVWLCLLPLLGAGCLDVGRVHVPPSIPTPELSYAEEVFRMVVVTDEYFPIPGASIYVVALGLNLTVNETGGATIGGMAPGDYDVVVSREGFKTNRTNVAATTNQSDAFAIQLEKLPRLHPHYGMSWPRGVGTCSAYWIDPAIHDQECRNDPDPNYSPVVRLELPLELVDAVVNMTWEASGLAWARELRFDVRMLDHGDATPFADGRQVLTVEGETGLSVHIDDGLISSAMRERNQTLEVLAFPSAKPQESKFYNQRFDVSATVTALLPPAA